MPTVSLKNEAKSTLVQRPVQAKPEESAFSSTKENRLTVVQAPGALRALPTDDLRA